MKGLDLTTLPEVPALAEALPGFSIASWQAIFAPAGAPQPVVDRLSGELIKAINGPNMNVKLVAQCIEPTGATPAKFRAF